MRLNKTYLMGGLAIACFLLVAGGILWFGQLPQKTGNDNQVVEPAPPPPETDTGKENSPPQQTSFPAGFDVFIDKNPAFPPDRKEEYRAMFDHVVALIKKGEAAGTDWTNLGSIKYSFKDYTGAEAAWLYAVSIDPFSTVAYYNLGQLYWHELLNYPKAEEMFRKLIDADTSGGVWYVYKDLSDLYRFNYKAKANLAAGVLREGVNQYPDNENLLMALARFYLQTGNDTEAIVWYKKVLEISPHNESAKEELERLKEKQSS